MLVLPLVAVSSWQGLRIDYQQICTLKIMQNLKSMHHESRPSWRLNLRLSLVIYEPQLLPIFQQNPVEMTHEFVVFNWLHALPFICSQIENNLLGTSMGHFVAESYGTAVFDVHRAVHRNIVSVVKLTRCTNVSNVFYFGMILYMFRTVFPS